MSEKRTLPIRPAPRLEAGAALIVSLLILLIMTIIGVTAMTTNSLEEKIAGNAKDLNLAFQAAESGLRAGEWVVQNKTLTTFDTSCTNALCLPAPSGSTPVWQTINWNGSAPCCVPVTGPCPGPATSSCRLSTVPAPPLTAKLAAQPSYIVEDVTTAFGCLPGETCVVGFGPAETSWYRITARGVGGTSSAVAMTQSVYRKP